MNRVPVVSEVFGNKPLPKKKGSDYTVMMVIAFGSDGRIYVIDFIRDKMKLSEKRDKILELIEKWCPSIVFWEENASVEGGEHIDEEIQKRGWAGLQFYAFRQPTTISKEDRIGKLEPDFRAGKILFLYERWYRMYDGMDRDLVQDFLNDEYLVMTMAGYPPRPKAESQSDALSGVRRATTICSTASQTSRTRNSRGRSSGPSRRDRSSRAAATTATWSASGATRAVDFSADDLKGGADK